MWEKIVLFISLILSSLFQHPQTIKHVVIPTSSSVYVIASPIPSPSTTQDNTDWGKTTQTGPHSYTTKVTNDSAMATPQEIFQALNNYRQVHGAAPLQWNDTLASYAQVRVSQCPTDVHAGLDDYLRNHNGKQELGFGAIGENCAWGYTLSGVHLIEWIYAGDEDHNSVQLDTEFQYVGIAVSGTNNEILFGGSKF